MKQGCWPQAGTMMMMMCFGAWREACFVHTVFFTQPVNFQHLVVARQRCKCRQFVLWNLAHDLWCSFLALCVEGGRAALCCPPRWL